LTRGEALEGVAEADRDRLFDTLTQMKANLIGKSAQGPTGERRVSNG
jgi:hypothetical protein